MLAADHRRDANPPVIGGAGRTALRRCIKDPLLPGVPQGKAHSTPGRRNRKVKTQVSG